jgi:hypothetical protein
MTQLAPVVFLLDVDNTLLDNDRIIADLKQHLTQAFGVERQQRYWKIFEQRRAELGYADYLGALQRYRDENPGDPNFLEVSFYLLEYQNQSRRKAENMTIHATAAFNSAVLALKTQSQVVRGLAEARAP